MTTLLLMLFLQAQEAVKVQESQAFWQVLRAVPKHYQTAGPVPLRTDLWDVTFQWAFELSGDAFIVGYDVMVTARRPMVLLRPSYGYHLTEQLGSTCSAMYIGQQGTDGVWRETYLPSLEEQRRRQDAGECPTYALRLWQMRDPADR